MADGRSSTKVPEVQLRLAVTQASSEDEVWLLLQRHRSAKGDVCHVGIDVTEGLKVEATVRRSWDGLS